MFDEDDNPATRNHRSVLMADGSVTTYPVPTTELIALRKKATDGKAEVTLRSCWECNPAHRHFLDGPWGNIVIRCFACGRAYFEGVDLSDYTDEEQDDARQNLS